MKIIGEGKDDILIAEISKDEVANLLGEYSKWSDGIKLSLKPGAEIDVRKMYKIASDFRAARDNILKMIPSLEHVLSILNEIPDVTKDVEKA